MKRLPAFLLVLFALGTKAQEKNFHPKRDNVFITAELSKILKAGAFDKKYGWALAYNRLLPHSRLGIGAGLEVVDIRTRGLGGILPALDLRYYATLGKSTFIPLAQAGYNFYRYRYQAIGSAHAYEEKGGLGYTFGLGYSYSPTGKGSGLYGAFRFRGLQYRYSDPQLPKVNTSERLNLSIGWRF